MRLVAFTAASLWHGLALAQAVGPSVELVAAYVSPSSAYDAGGEREQLPERASDTNLLVALRLAYALGFGSKVGIDVPFVRRSTELVVTRRSGSGLGDVSLYAAYEYLLGDALKLAARGRLKAASGTGPEQAIARNEAPTGSGNTNVQLSLLAAAELGGVELDTELGRLIARRRVVSATTEVDDGDAWYADLRVGYRLFELLTPHLELLLLTQSDRRQVEAGMATTEKDTGVEWLALALDVHVEISAMLTVYAGWGAPLDGYGMNLSSGYVLRGKNTRAGPRAFNIGAKATF